MTDKATTALTNDQSDNGPGHSRVRRASVPALLARLTAIETENVALRAQLAVERSAAARAVELARALDQSKQQAEALSRAKDDFVAMLGHELRNPLGPITTALQLMRIQGLDTSEQEVIERHTAHLLRLVDDMLDIARITRGKVDLRRERFEFSQIVGRAIEMARPLLEQKKHELVVSVPTSGLPVDADPSRVAQILSNLLTNAAKYSEEGIRVDLYAERVGDVVRVSVEDRGIGIEPELLDRIFQHFVQTDEGTDRARGGLGLGLAIVRSLVTLHGGTVHAHSEGKGKGSRFVVELPVTHEPITPQEKHCVHEPRSATTIEPRARILVVDDNEDAAELFATLLSSVGYRAVAATSGEEALDLLDRFAPDAALLDIGLPDIDGYDLAASVKSRAPATRLIALTGYGHESDRKRSRAAGFHAHLVKPVNLGQIEEALELLLNREAR